MKFDLRAYDARPVIKKQAIYVAGAKVGEVTESVTNHGSQFHAILNITCAGIFNAGIAQGFGESVEEAMADAFASNREDARAYLAGLDDLENKLGNRFCRIKTK